tara:strand:+ start:5852 stop:6805 length:954 start_codon:yes stop_codon:yes gene_type:complete
MSAPEADQEPENFDDLSDPVDVLNSDDVEVEVVDDVPEEDQNRPARAEVSEADEDDEDDSQFGNRVQKRISKLRYEWNEERRAKEQAFREGNEAVNYARSVQSQNEALKEQVGEQRRLLYDQVSAKTDAEIEGAKRSYRDAYEGGDPDQIADAQEELARLHAEKSQFMYNMPEPSVQQPVQQPQPQPQAAEVQAPDPTAVDWIKRNPWFQQPGYEEMTGFAIGVHEKLVKQGVDPRSDPAYYEQIDSVMHQQFAEYFGQGKTSSEAPTSRRTPVVAPARRGGKGPRKVELTGTQVSLARKLGISPEQYAAQVVKEMT